MKARFAIGIGIAIVAIITVVYSSALFTGNETNKSTGPGQNSTTSSPPPGRHLILELSDRVGVKQSS
ncbi:MAG: hypothetical protein E6L02_06465 [Thaumarchaeota archaeon]|nr:MAG: hypothetical protein E6L02_06465 [Nitrososphaerota archaeon]